jgi:uncharacterized protein with von Willebrand factor type A (vWA) domain
MGTETAILATAVLGAGSSIMSGMQQKKAYKQQAEQATMAAEANITDRTRALNEAMATQNAMMGSSGRTMDSISSVLEGDKKRYESEAKMIRAGAQSQSAQYKSAGQSAMGMGVINAAGQGAKAYQQYSMLKTPEEK